MSNRIESFLVKAGAVALSGLAIYVTIELVNETTSGQSNTVILMAYLAIAVSVIGLLFSRYAYARKAYGSMILGATLWVVGAAWLMQNELSFWKSAYDIRYAEYKTSQNAMARKEGLTDLAFKSVITGQSRETAAQIEAEIKGKKFDPLYDRTKQCTDATAVDSRAYCAELAQMEANYAAAVALERDEAVIAKSEAAGNERGLSYNVLAGAEALSSWFGGDVKVWAERLILLTVLFLFLVRDMPLFIAFAPDKRREGLGKAKASQGMDRPDYARKPVSDENRTLLDAEAWDRFQKALAKPPQANEKMQELLAQPAPWEAPEPDGDGTPKAEEANPDSTEPSSDVKSEDDATVVSFPNSKPPQSKREILKQKKERMKEEDIKLIEAYVVARLDTEHPSAQIELTPKGNHKRGGTSGKEIYRDFLLYRKHHGITRSIGRSWFGELVGEFVDRARNSKGAVYGAVIKSEEKRRMVA